MKDLESSFEEHKDHNVSMESAGMEYPSSSQYPQSALEDNDSIDLDD